MEASDRAQPSKSKRRQRRRNNKSGLISNNGDRTVQENVSTTIPKKDNKIQLRPSEIRYSQCSIACKFSDDTNIGTLLDDLIFGRCFASAIPMIEVSMMNNHWVSADNRRLWVFKQLEILSRIETITVKVVKRIYQGKLTSNNAGLTVEIRGYPTGQAYNVLHARNPDQYPLKSKRNRRKRKTKSKLNDNGSTSTPDSVCAANASTNVLQQADSYDHGTNSVRVNAMQNEGITGYGDPSSINVNNTMDVYARYLNDSEIEYSDFIYSDSDMDDEEYRDYDYTSSNDSFDDASDTDNKLSRKSLAHRGDTLDSLEFCKNKLEDMITDLAKEINKYETPKQIQKKSDGLGISDVFTSQRNNQVLNVRTGFREPGVLSSSREETNYRINRAKFDQTTTWSSSSLASSRGTSGYGRAERLVPKNQPDITRERFTGIQNRQSTPRENMQELVFTNEVKSVNIPVKPHFASDPFYTNGRDFEDSQIPRVKQSYVQPIYKNCSSQSYHDDTLDKALVCSICFGETPAHEFWCIRSPLHVEHNQRREKVIAKREPDFLGTVLTGISKLGDFLKDIFKS